MPLTFRNAPLVEIIAELRWPPAGCGRDSVSGGDSHSTVDGGVGQA
jgi:hypothetical protein